MGEWIGNNDLWNYVIMIFSYYKNRFGVKRKIDKIDGYRGILGFVGKVIWVKEFSWKYIYCIKIIVYKFKYYVLVKNEIFRLILWFFC